MKTQHGRGTQEVDGIQYKYASDWIHKLESEDHWRAYWHQANLILDILQPGDTVLEIGPGSGFLTNYLRSRGYQVTTLDIDEGKSPDITANIVEYPFPDSYDHILAFEVFEHIPYDKFKEIIPRLRKTARKNIFLSVPKNYRIWVHADLIVPVIKHLSFTFKTRRTRIIEPNHFWELGHKGLSTRKLSRMFESNGLKLKRVKRFRLVTFFHLHSE